jgi:hypothetical protein
MSIPHFRILALVLGCVPALASAQSVGRIDPMEASAHCA